MKPFLFISIIFLIGLVSAAGVATPYWDENPLKLASGESTTITLNLQNMVGEEDMNIEASIKEDTKGIATIVNGPEYSVAFGSEDVPVKIKIEVPKNAKIGDSYIVSLSFRQVSSGEGGMLHVAGAFTSNIPIEIVGSAESELYGKPSGINPLFLLALFGMIIISISIIVWKIKKSRKPRAKSQ